MVARGTLDEGRSLETRLLTPSITSSPPPWLLSLPLLPLILLGRQICASLMECLLETETLPGDRDTPRMADSQRVV